MHKLIFALLLSLTCLSGSSLAQEKLMAPPLKSITLFSPFDPGGRNAVFRPELYAKSCLNLLTLEYGCGSSPTIDFGTRIGVNINLFKVAGGKNDQTRMVLVGDHKWTDDFVLPVVEPWAPLAPDEKRSIVMNASGGTGTPGGNGRNGSPGVGAVAGMNGDGTLTTFPSSDTVSGSKNYASAPVTLQVSTTVKNQKGMVKNSEYSPIVEARKGGFYMIRVLEGPHDFYVVLRVDELVAGKAITLSYFKLDLPKAL